MRRTSSFLAVLAVSLLVFTGCSSDETASDSTSTTSGSTSEASFADQVNALCGDSTVAMGEIFGPMSSLDGPPTEEMLQSTYDALLSHLQDEQKELASLTPPESQAAAWDALIAANDDAVAIVEEQGVGYFDDEESNPFAEVETMAVDMGFDACATGEG